MSFSPGTQRPRCTGLDLDIEWSAEPLAPGGAPGSGGPRAAAVGGESLHGMARCALGGGLAGAWEAAFRRVLCTACMAVRAWEVG